MNSSAAGLCVLMEIGYSYQVLHRLALESVMSLWPTESCSVQCQAPFGENFSLHTVDTVHASGSLDAAVSKMQVHFYFLVHINRGTGLLVTELVSMRNSILRDTRVHTYTENMV